MSQMEGGRTAPPPRTYGQGRGSYGRHGHNHGDSLVSRGWPRGRGFSSSGRGSHSLSGGLSKDPEEAGDGNKGAWRLGVHLSQLSEGIASSPIVTAVKHQIPRSSSLKRLAFYDFDNTILRTLDQKAGCEAYFKATGVEWSFPGYYGHVASLTPPCLRQPLSAHVNVDIVSRLEADIQHPETAVIILTARREFGGIGTRLRDIVAELGFAAVPVVCNPFSCDGCEFKITFILGLVDALLSSSSAPQSLDDFPALGAAPRRKAPRAAPPPFEVILYDDNTDHAVQFDTRLREELTSRGQVLSQFFVPLATGVAVPIEDAKEGRMMTRGVGGTEDVEDDDD